MMNKIKRQLKLLKPDKLYTADQIVKMGLILDVNLKPSRFRVYRLIKNGEIPAVNLGKGKNPKYFVTGKDLKKYVETVMGIKV